MLPFVITYPPGKHPRTVLVVLGCFVCPQFRLSFVILRLLEAESRSESKRPQLFRNGTSATHWRDCVVLVVQ